jgi:kojibiose phosphorylase
MDKKAHPGNCGTLIKARTRFTGATVVEAQKSRVTPGFITVNHRNHVNEFDVVDEWSWTGDAGQIVTIDKFVSVYTSRDGRNPGQSARTHLRRLEGRGFNELLRDHVAAWQDRWTAAAVTVKGDDDAQHALNFACYHLISAGNDEDERVSISARSLTGSIYKGHIFWDAEMFIAPFFIFTHPATARAMLMYRYHTLAGARENARKKGYRGALYAWESTASGIDMTPAAVLDPRGEIVPVLSGKLEHHIDSAVAYAVWSYWNATGDDAFLLEAGAEMLIETARFWESRVESRGGVYHIDGVEGPDEYHDEGVDDNFYTNAMAAWNLRRAADIMAYLKSRHPVELARLQDRTGLTMGEPDRWHAVAAGLYRDMERGSLIEQFQGYFSLEDIDISQFVPRTAPLDVVLGHRRTVNSQAVKQADVVMALYLLEDELDEETIRRSFEYYDRRTAHGSSLSPAIHGLVAARLGLADAALEYFSMAAHIDLTAGNAAGGIHVAALGALWQQVIMGFAGVRITIEGIYLYPRLPEGWEQLDFSLTWRGMRLGVEVAGRQRIIVTVSGEGVCAAGILGGSLQAMAAGGRYVSEWSEGAWQQFNPWSDDEG